MTEKSREEELKSFLDLLCIIADKEYQKKFWISKESHVYDDINYKLLCFVDLVDNFIDQYKNYQITNHQLEKLIELNNKIDFFLGEYAVCWGVYSTKHLIGLPEWIEIQQLSMTFIKSFNHTCSKIIQDSFRSLPNQDTRNRFLNCIIELSNEKLLNRYWGRRKNSLDDNLDQTISDFFSIGKSILFNHNELNLSEEQFKLLSSLWGLLDYFSNKFDSLSLPSPEEKLITNDEWKLFQKISKETVNMLRETNNFR